MGRIIINKHIDDSSKLKRKLFHDDLLKAKGEIVINNDPSNPSIYIVDNNDNVVSISGGNSGSGDFDDSKIWQKINEHSSSITQLQNDEKELKELVDANTRDIEDIKNADIETVLKEDITVAGLIGQFGAGNYSNNDVIPAGTSFTEILINLLHKEIYPENIIIHNANASVFLENLTIEFDCDELTAEVGTLVSLISGETNGVYYETTEVGVYGMDYGYSFNNDNTRISTDTYITKPCVLTNVDDTYKLSASINSGFDADNNVYKKNCPSNVIQEGGAKLETTILGCLNEGDNEITLTAFGPKYSYSAETIDSIFYCSNLGKTAENKCINSINSPSTTLDLPEKKQAKKIKGCYKYFLGYSDYQSVEEFKNHPSEIRNLTVKSGFIEKDGLTTIVNDNKIKSNGKSIVIACPKKYRLRTIDNGVGTDLMGSFKSQGEVTIQTGMIETIYNVYLLPVSNGAELEFKNVTLINN
jgi:hypothetical protein